MAYLEFAGEAHGFRRAENIIRAKEAELYAIHRACVLHFAEKRGLGAALFAIVILTMWRTSSWIGVDGLISGYRQRHTEPKMVRRDEIDAVEVIPVDSVVEPDSSTVAAALSMVALALRPLGFNAQYAIRMNLLCKS